MKSSRSMYSSRENGTLRVPGRRILRVVDGVELLDLALGIVLDHHLQRPQHGHHARRALVQVLAHACSSSATSMTFSFLATPIASQKSRIASGV